MSTPDYKGLQNIVLKALNQSPDREFDIKELLIRYDFPLSIDELARFGNKQLITPGYANWGSGMFNFSITKEGTNYIENKSLPDFFTKEASLMPNIKPHDWCHKDVVLHKPILDLPNPLLPLVTYGYDKPDSFMFIYNDTPLEPPENIHQSSFENIKNEPSSFFEFDAGGFTIIICSDSYFAAEKILDKDFLLTLQERLDTEFLAISIPRKGTMFATQGIMLPDAMDKFKQFTQLKYDEDESSEPLSNIIFAVNDGEISGTIDLE